MIEKAPIIEIKIIDGNAWPLSDMIKINAMGLENTKREEADDHYVYFGSAKEMNGKIINDVICSKIDGFAE